MRISLEITNDDIAYAEKILLKEGEKFDCERRDFIKNLDTIDLQAVPGSGKTTALLAKLLILESKMPFPDGSGILVLSHTNTAVDEIKEKLELIAPKLFKFPNFIGTIQSFVDEFLAKPYLVNCLGISISHIDSDYYQNKLIKSFKEIYWAEEYEKPGGLFYGRHILKARSESGGNKKMETKICEKYAYDEIKDLYFDFKDKKIKLFTDHSALLKDPANKKYIGIKKIIFDCLKEGVISYDYAYHLGGNYLSKFPKIIKILQNRFKFVFVDEMQDMGAHQVDILEDIFYKKLTLNHSFQRIGDRNQAIYGGEVKAEDEWTGGHRKVLIIKGTHRLTQSVADTVKYFGIEYIAFNGLRTLSRGDGVIMNDIKPTLLVYKNEHLNSNDSGGDKILDAFSLLVLRKKEEGYFQDIKNPRKFICKAVLWNAKPQENKDGSPKFDIGSCRAKHYFYDYDMMGVKSKKKTWFQYEKDYLFYYDKGDSSLSSKYKNIINLLLRILRSNDLNNPDTGMRFTKYSLFEFLKKKYLEKYISLQEKLYIWSRKLTDISIDEVAQEMDDYFFDDLILGVFEKKLYKTILVSEISSVPITTSLDSKEMNIYSGNGINIEVGTVHSVKGETHACTLYLETSSNGYESTDKIKTESFLGMCGSGKPSYTASYGKQAMKMLYVGLSRPTHLLCYAIHEDRYNELIAGTGNKERLEELWEVKTIST